MPTTPPYTVDIPGRGAWTRTGGLLPIKGGSSGYYRLAVGEEVPIGSSWVRGTNKGHTSRVVNGGVRALQAQVGLTGADVDGWFGPKTDKAVRAAQSRLGVKVDGIVGPSTMRALLNDEIKSRHLEVPYEILGGLLVFESGLDPAAVGVNGWDTGLAQINLSVHQDITVETALDPVAAIDWTVENLRDAYDRFVGKTTADAWDIAIAWHNSPVAATAWARTGAPVFDEDRSIQIDEYVRRVKAAWLSW